MASDEREKGATALLRTLANVRRLQILGALSGGELSVGDLLEQVPLTQSAISQHLAKLRAQKLVTTRRNAQTIYYRIVDEEALAMAGALLRMAARRAGETA